MSHHFREASDPEIAFGCHCGCKGKVTLKVCSKKRKLRVVTGETRSLAFRLFEAFVLLCGILLFGYALVVGFCRE